MPYSPGGRLGWNILISFILMVIRMFLEVYTWSRIPLFISRLIINGHNRHTTNGPRIYPNPVQDKIYISFYEEKGNIHLLSMDGKLIASWNLGRGTQSFDLSSLSNGCYMLNLQSEKSTWKQLVIKTGYH
jgi:hypothetical protein